MSKRYRRYGLIITSLFLTICIETSCFLAQCLTSRRAVGVKIRSFTESDGASAESLTQTGVIIGGSVEDTPVVPDGYFR